LGFEISLKFGAWDWKARSLLHPRYGEFPLRSSGSVSRLFPRIGFGNDQTDGVLIEAFESPFALEILQMTHARPSP